MTSLAFGMKLSYPKVGQSIKEVHQKKVINLNHCTQFNFLEAEELGVGQPRRCGTCINCKRCSVRSRAMSVKETADLPLIEENIKFDQEKGVVTFEYPIVGDINKLEDNWKQAIAIKRKVEERLEKHG